jgi:acyl carrier protein
MVCLTRSYVLFRTLQTIYDLTGYGLEETSYLDFEHHKDVMGEVESKLCDEFCLIELPDCDTVSELVDSICEGVGIYMTRDEILGIVRSSLAAGLEAGKWDASDYPEDCEIWSRLDSLGVVEFVLRLQGLLGIEITDDESEALWQMNIGEIADWLLGAIR